MPSVIAAILLIVLFVLMIIGVIKNKQFRSQLAITIVITIIFTIGCLYPGASIYCSTLLGLFTIPVYCILFTLFEDLPNYMKKPSESKIMACYLLPTCGMYMLILWFIYSTASSLGEYATFFKYLEGIHQTIGLGFIINAIFKYFDKIKELRLVKKD
jgi:hypothetical protein